MRRKNSKIISTFAEMLSIVAISVLAISCQSPGESKETFASGKRKIPNMWVPKDSSIAYEAHFRNKQLKQLSAYFKGDQTDSIMYPLASMEKLLTYCKDSAKYTFFRLYLGMYDSGVNVPAGFQGKLTILFAPLTDTSSDPMHFFSITPSGFFNPQSDSCLITHDRWIKGYLNTMHLVLTPNLEGHAPENQFDSIASDTRMITYDSFDIEDLRREIIYQRDSNHVSTSGYKAFFSAFGPTRGTFASRIFTQFELTTKSTLGKDSVYYIDDQPDFSDRQKPTKPFHPTLFGMDNGHLCPPSCP